jgi:hypothetical protein
MLEDMAQVEVHLLYVQASALQVVLVLLELELPLLVHLVLLEILAIW